MYISGLLLLVRVVLARQIKIVMKYILALDTIDLDEKFGSGVAIIYGTTERGSYFIQETMELKDKREFWMEVEKLKERYQPTEIKHWN